MGNLGGMDFTCLYHPAGSDSSAIGDIVPHFKVFVHCAVEGSFSVRRERLFHKFLKTARAIHEVQSGERRFDRAFYLDTETPALARVFFAEAEKREAIRTLFKLGFSEVSLANRKMTARRSAVLHLKPLTGETIREAAAALRVLRKAVAFGSGEERERVRQAAGAEAASSRKYAGEGYVFMILLLTVSLYTAKFGVLRYSLVEDGESMRALWTGAGLLLFLLLMLPLGFILRGRADSRRKLMTFMWPVLLMSFMLPHNLVPFANGFFDPAPAATARRVHLQHLALGHQKEEVSDYNPLFNAYYAVTAWGEEGGGAMHFRIDRDLYDALHDAWDSQGGNVDLLIETRPGYLGREWVVAARVAGRQDVR
jgi:hypothetical protein